MITPGQQAWRRHLLRPLLWLTGLWLPIYAGFITVSCLAQVRLIWWVMYAEGAVFAALFGWMVWLWYSNEHALDEKEGEHDAE